MLVLLPASGPRADSKFLPMRRLLLGLPFIVLAAGCGGNGKNPTTPDPSDNDLPAYASYPAYRAISAEDGNELYLQVRDDEGEFDGRYAFFIKEGGNVIDIMDGPVEGTVNAEGTIHMTLRNPYDETSEPIEIEGHREGGNLVMADVENPADVETFEPLEEEPLTITRTGPLDGFWVDIDAVANKFDKQTMSVSYAKVPFWLLPPTFAAIATSTSSEFINKFPYESITTGWGNGWTQVVVGYADNRGSKFSGWVPRNPLELSTSNVNFSSAQFLPTSASQHISVNARLRSTPLP